MSLIVSEFARCVSSMLHSLVKGGINFAGLVGEFASVLVCEFASVLVCEFICEFISLRFCEFASVLVCEFLCEFASVLVCYLLLFRVI